MSVKLVWNEKSAPEELWPMLSALGEGYPVRRGRGPGIALSFKRIRKQGACEVCFDGAAAAIGYDTPAQAGRAVGALLSGLVKKGRLYSETCPFTMLGVMLDCSRNAVMTCDHLQVWMRRLTLLGYNTVMLYTEDTYELPGEPWFGFQRGAYSAAELKAIEEYAARLGIEVIPCIQTLGHLEKILRHGAYWPVKDTASVMLVGEPKTYELIGKMVKQWSSICRTKRIHIGMDETHDLGRGRYMDLHGYRKGFDLFNEHLGKVVEICKQHGLSPMIWSDMYFRLGCVSGSYYDPATNIPPAVVKRIPGEAQLVYWDYYHMEKSFYVDWISRHRAMGKEPLMGSGIWTWDRYWYDRRTTEASAGPCIEACLETGVKELFFTMWGDNGAYCDHDSAFAGMAWCADKSYGTAKPSVSELRSRFAAVCGGDYDAHVLGSELHGGIEGMHPNVWDDPIFESHLRFTAKDDPARMEKIAKGFRDLSKKLAAHAKQCGAGRQEYVYRVADHVAQRYTLSAMLLAAYRRKDRRTMRAAQAKITPAIASVKALERAFRAMWMSHNKPEGMETIQARLGMLEARYRELDRRIAEYLDGKVDRIAELECNCAV